MLVPITTFPTDLDLRPNLQPIRNQGSQGTCAAQTAACCKEWQEKKDIGLNEHFSPQFIYNHRVNKTTEGMYGRDVMKILHKTGASIEKDFPYGTNIIDKQIKFYLKDQWVLKFIITLVIHMQGTYQLITVPIKQSIL